MCRALCGGLGRVRQCDLLHGLLLRGTEFFIIAMAILRAGYQSMILWIGSRENLNRKPSRSSHEIWGVSEVSCKFSLKPIH